MFEMKPRERVRCLISELYKELYGVRPRHLDFDTWEYGDLVNYFNSLQKYYLDRDL